MYCVKCGVKLNDGTERCPLCGTPVWNPEETVKEKTYPDALPHHYKDARTPEAVVLTVVLAVVCGTILAICLGLYGKMNWGSYVVFGIALFYILVIFPMWFRTAIVEVFVPLDHVAIGLYALFVCIKTGGHWFLSFAFPITGMMCLLNTAIVILLKHLDHGRPFIFGGYLMILGGFTMLIEFFEHITFQAPMFKWSLFSAGFLAGAGLFLIIAGCIKPLRMAMRKKFFY